MGVTTQCQLATWVGGAWHAGTPSACPAGMSCVAAVLILFKLRTPILFNKVMNLL